MEGERLVVVNEQVGDLGGTERVLGAILDRYPAARLLAPRFEVGNVPAEDALPWSNPTEVIDFGRRKLHFLAPLYARRLAAVRVEAAVAITLVHAGWPLAVRLPQGSRHVCYSAGPPSWLFGGDLGFYLRDYPPTLRPALRGATSVLRAHYRRLMQRPDCLLTNSAWSAEALGRACGRSARVVYPPVKTEFFTPAPRERGHVLVVARLVGKKRVDVVVEAFRGLEERLVVVGGGSLLEPLRAQAPANVRFTGFVADEELRELYRSSRALVCPSVEDFGIVMAEAQACGVPVIAPRAGGAREIVRDGVTGIHLDAVAPRSVAEALRSLRGRPFDPAACRASAERFSEARFVAEVEQVVDEELARLEGPGRLAPPVSPGAGRPSSLVG